MNELLEKHAEVIEKALAYAAEHSSCKFQEMCLQAYIEIRRARDDKAGRKES